MLRIAVPAWRVSSNPMANTNDVRNLSRDEMQSLFRGDLKRKTLRFRRMTDHEKWQMDMSSRLRDALSRKINLA